MRVPPHVKGKMIVQPAMLFGMQTVPVTSSRVKKREVTEKKTCRWACGHTLRDHAKNKNIKERMKVESITERCRKLSKAEAVWPRKEEIPRLCRKKDSYLEMVPPERRKRGRPKQRWMDSVNRDMRAIGTTKEEVHDRTGWRKIGDHMIRKDDKGNQPSGWEMIWTNTGATRSGRGQHKTG